MDEKFLVELGLRPNDARSYRLLVLRGSLKPTQLQKLTGESRVNCYAILDRLVEQGLAIKKDENKRLTYYPESPKKLEELLRAQLVEAEKKLARIDEKMPQMLTAFNDKKGAPVVRHYRGESELAKMYYEQIEQEDRELYFLRSIADQGFFGRTKMDSLRILVRELPKGNGKKRYGITPSFYDPKGPEGDKYSRLTRTWLSQDDYRDPVEWAVSGDLVQAISFKGDGFGVSIENAEIAESFKNILKLLSKYIKKDPDYEEYVPKGFKNITKHMNAEVKSILRNNGTKAKSIASYILRPIPSVKEAMVFKKGQGGYRLHPIDLKDPRSKEPLVNIADFGIDGSSYYSRPNRLTGEPVVGVQSDVWLRQAIVEKLQKVDEYLKTDQSVHKKYGQHLHLLIDEGFRDIRVQNHIYDTVFPEYFYKLKPGATQQEMEEARTRTLARGSEHDDKVDPKSPPPHYTGAAVDLKIVGEDGVPLTFGLTSIVQMGKQALSDFYEQIDEAHSVKDDTLARQNRRLLYWLMHEQGFENNPEEWWHYSIGDQMWARTGRHAKAYYSIPPNIPEFNKD